VGLSEAVLDEFGDFAVDAPLPAATAFRTGRALWLDSEAAIAGSFPRVIVAGSKAIACLPLLMDKKRMGVVVLGHPGPREFPPSDRALLHDLCRQASIALDRSRLLARAERAERAKDHLLAMLGHELRNPLSPIVNSIQLLRLRGDEKSGSRELEVIERQVRNLVRVVDHLLDLERTKKRPSTEALAPLAIETSKKARARILIVDDNVDGANILDEALRELGYSAMVAHDPASALHAASSIFPDVALIDIGLPSIDGYELARELRLRDALQGVRFIAITGYGSDADRRRLKDAGFEAHLVKPVELATLDETLKALLQDNSSRSSRTAG
jgi:CheY-like chemotaxis protein